MTTIEIEGCASEGSAPSESIPLTQNDETPKVSWKIRIVVSALMGLLFGTAFYKSHVYEPMIIRGQFLFRRFVMLKMFLAAMGTGALIFSALSFSGSPNLDSVRRRWKSIATSRGWLTGATAGGVLLGVGMAVSGACPGMVLAAFGAGTPYSVVTILGGLFGALVYGLNADAIEASILRRGAAGKTSTVYADEATGIAYYKLSAALAVFCMVGCTVLEIVVPWQNEVPSRFESAMQEPSCEFGSWTFSFLRCPAWPPSLGGVVVGFLQLPAILFIENILGSTAAYQICASIWIIPFPRHFHEKFSHLATYARPKPTAWWQLFFVTLAAFAAFLCSVNAGDFGSAAGLSPAVSFTGGFLLIFGSRLGGGCTSGHGLSGSTILMFHSWIAVVAMFSGGILVAVVWQTAKGDFFQSSVL